MTTRTIPDLDQAVYDRRHASLRLMTAVRSLRPADDAVLTVATRHPQDGRLVTLTEDEEAIAAEWERRSDVAIAQIRAEHQRMRRRLETRR